MTRCLRLGSVALAVLALVPIRSAAQSLGEVARKAKEERKEREERERQKGKDKPIKSYSNDDLAEHADEVNWDPEAGRTGPKPRRGLAADSKGRLDEDGRPVAPEGPPGVGAEEVRDERKAQWQLRAQQLGQRQQAAEAAVRAAEAQLSDAGARALQSTDTNEILRLQAERETAEQRLSEARVELEEARKERVVLEEEARQQGVPPGWIR